MENAGALDEIPEFANIARPAMLHQQRHRRIVETAFGIGGHLPLEMADQCRNILGAVGKAGDLQHNHAEPEEQVFAEFAIGDRSAEILVGGRNDADVDGFHLAAADADDRPVFEHAEQFDLHVETHVADFVEEERPALGRFKMADAAGMGAGKAALFMPEKFGFDQFAGDRAAVDRGESLAGADAFVVNGAGDEFLARTRRAAEHHRSVRAGDAADHLAQPTCGRARADDQRFERRLVVLPHGHFSLHRAPHRRFLDGPRD